MLDALNFLRVYTARDENKTLVGYQVFLLRQSLHYQDVYQATQDLLFIDPNRRGFGMKFLEWCDDQLKFQGVNVVYQTVTTRFDYGPILKKLGYEPAEQLYVRRIK